MYSAFKKAIRNLSLTASAPQCPTSFVATKDESIKQYVAWLLNEVTSCKRKYQPKSWWSVDVLSLLLGLHLQATAQYSVCEQSLDWFGGKAVEARTKFERDQKNRELEIRVKRQKEEDEQEDALRRTES
jgi:hypothetical protein